MSNHDVLRQNLVRLRSPITDQGDLSQLLFTSLKLLNVRNDSTTPSSDEPLNFKSLLRYIPEYQITILDNVVPHWLDQLQESGNLSLLTDYFIPPRSERPTFAAHAPRMESILSAYCTLTGNITSQFSVDVLARLSQEVTLLDVFGYLLDGTDHSSINASQRWSDYMTTFFSVPGKASNATASGKVSLPAKLEVGSFLSAASREWSSLVCHPSYKQDDEAQREAASLLLGRLVTLGCFPPQPPLLPTNISFWSITIPKVARDNIFHQASSNEEEIAPALPETKFSMRLRSTMTLLPISQQLAIVTSLLSHLDLAITAPINSSSVGLDGTDRVRGVVKRESLLLWQALGDIATNSGTSEKTKGNDKGVLVVQPSIWPLVSAVLDKRFTEGIARVIVCWAAQSRKSESALETLLDRSLELWCDQDHIRHSTLQRHRAVTCLLLSTISQLSSMSLAQPNEEGTKKGPDKRIQRLATTGTFITAVGTYIEHSEPSIRRCGMLTAEIVAKMVGSKLQFPGWEDDGDGQEWARQMRTFLQERDVDATAVFQSAPPTGSSATSPGGVHSAEMPSRSPPPRVTILENNSDSDDSLEGYASETPSSSRAPSPPVASHVGPKPAHIGNPSSSSRPTIEEINEDPTLLNPLRKKIQKPVYLLDLGKLFKVGKEGNEELESIEVALSTAASLIRKKAGWGLELDENAVDLTHSLIGLQNNYEIEDFDHKVLEALTALVVCSPRKAALCIIEHFFTPTYSISQRFNMLNALALGARELAGLPTPQISPPKPSFPSKLLPPPAHRKYYTADDEADASMQIRGLVESISTRAIDSGREEAEGRVPEIVRERQLTVRLNQGGRAGGIVDLSKETSSTLKITPPSNTKPANIFNQVAAEYFILPFVAKFWDYLQDTLTREELSARTSRTGEAGFRAAGTAMILSPLVLSHFVNTMSIMVHASRHSPAFLSMVAPAVLELAVTLGTRKMSSEPTKPSPFGQTFNEDSKRIASVLSASLELAIVILDASIALDAGKTLALEHGNLVSGTMLWAQKAFSMLDGGLQLEGMGGSEEVRLRRASAGLVLKVEEITRKWSQAMLLPF